MEKVWERREELKKRYNIRIDRWVTMEERKERFIIMKMVFKLREENRKRGLNIDLYVEGGKDRIGGR